MRIRVVVMGGRIHVTFFLGLISIEDNHSPLFFFSQLVLYGRWFGARVLFQLALLAVQ